MGWTHKTAAIRQFARQAWALTLPYFRSEERWRARGLLAAIVALNLGAVYMLVQLNEWNRVFYDALQNKNQPVFWAQLQLFCWLALGYMVIAVYKFYLTQLLELRWRAWLTHNTLARWLDRQVYYRLELARFGSAGQVPDNPEQRIQEDVQLFCTQTVSLSMGLLNALVTLGSFIGILWALSGDFSFTLGGTAYTIPGFMVWMALLYCGVGSVLAHLIGRKLQPLNFRQQQVEADFRHHMTRLREYSESIALSRGEPVEQQALGTRLGRVLDNALHLIKAQKNLTWFTAGFGQAAVVFPFVVAAPRFFSGAIQLGELIQIATAFGRVQDALSWFVDNYDSLASWHATTARLTSFEAALAREAQTAPTPPATGDHIQADGLNVYLPHGERLLAGASLSARAGQRVLLQGPSGSGKSTLFRALAGIWPQTEGRIQVPDDCMFIPQRTYLPNGPLREALAYPEPAERYSDAALREALHAALLPDLAEQLDRADAWSQVLSGGEQQRLAIARVLLKAPAWVLADEATSALDPATEAQLYQRLLALVERRGGGLISIAHRPNLAQWHPQTWTLEPAAQGSAGRYRLGTTDTHGQPGG